jgi:hypothetical protein
VAAFDNFDTFNTLPAFPAPFTFCLPPNITTFGLAFSFIGFSSGFVSFGKVVVMPLGIW